MANERLVLCGSARLTSPDRAWRGLKPLHLRLGRGNRDVHLRLEHLTEKMISALPDVAVGLLEVAAYVYAADQAVPRGGKVAVDYGARWLRRFRFEFPVRCPDVWQRHEVSEALAETLGFLSEDDYEFGFTRLTAPPPPARYLFDQSGFEGPADYEGVLLFSGGLDSLGGAIQEVLQGRHKVALVSHRPVSKIYRRQCDLVAALVDRLPERHLRPLHVAVEVNKGKRLSRDFNQRTRAFLFAAVAAAVARLFGLSRIRFYENGVTSLNLPVSPQVLGARSSRTTHPQTLKGFERLFKLLFDGRFGVENPFLWKTKAEVLEGIKVAGQGRLCARAGSCSHTHAQTVLRSHCGRCSQCLDRRLSALAAGLDDDEDPPEMYRSDVLTGPLDGKDLILAERYVGTMREVERIAGAAEFLARFGEVSRVLRHLDVPPAQGAELIFDLYHRHARGVCRALSAAVKRRSDEVVLTAYPANSLLSIGCGRRPVCPHPDTPGEPGGHASVGTPRLELLEETFEVRFGGETCFLGNTLEYHLLARLNQRPGTFVSIDALYEDVWQSTHTNKCAIQRVVSNLRRHLRNEGILELQIDGSQRDHYRLHF